MQDNTLYRRTQYSRQSLQSREVVYDSHAYLNFNSNDYMGMSSHPQVIEAMCEGAKQYGVGSGSANTLSGHTEAHVKLRAEIADWLKRDDVLLFPSGYQANLAVITAMADDKTHILADKLNHASLIDGMRLSGVPFSRYQHLNSHDAQKKAARYQDKKILWITESVFSMDGDSIDSTAMSDIAKSYRATLMIDEAHSLGWMGDEGAGMQSGNIIMGMMGKSIGTQGGFVAGSHDVIDKILQTARPYLFTTALSPAIAQASLASVRLIRQQDDARAHLKQLIQLFRAGASALGLPLMGQTDCPIQPILCKDLATVNRWAQQLKSDGVWISPIRYPTVPKDAPRIRITLTARHTVEDIERLLTSLKRIVNET